MGVKGLYTFISIYYDEALEWHRLRNCQVVIDGNNLAFDIFYSCKENNRAFGGDYDKYAVEVEHFFQKLRQCGIKPLIVMDGGQPLKRKKFGTAIQRNKDAICACMDIHPDNQNYMKIFSPLSFSVFVTVVQEMGIDVIQSDFEADDDIAVLAKELDAYVISNDSDFFLFDVPFVILNSLNYNIVKKRKGKSGANPFVPCYKFNQKKFTELSGVHKDLLPIFALILGNDYHNTESMKIFYRKFDSGWISTARGRRHKLIKNVTHWLAQQKPDPISVMKKILKYLPPSLSDEQRQTVKKLITEYSPEDSNLLCWITPHQDECPLFKTKAFEDSGIRTSLVPYTSTEFLPKKVKLELSCKCRARARTNLVVGNRLPMWFVHTYRHHLASRFVGDLLNKNYFFIHPLIEVEDYDSAYLKMEDIIKGIRAILWATIIKYDKHAQKTESRCLNFRDLLTDTSETMPYLTNDHEGETVHDDLSTTKSDEEEMVHDDLSTTKSDEEEMVHDDLSTTERSNEEPSKFSPNAKVNKTCVIPHNDLSSDSENEDNSLNVLLQTINSDLNKLEVSEETLFNNNSKPHDKIMDLPMNRISDKDYIKPHKRKKTKSYIAPSLDSKTHKGHIEPSLDSKTDKGHIEPSLDSKTDKGHIEPSLDSKMDKGHTEPSYDSKTDKADIEPHGSYKSKDCIEPSQDSKTDKGHIEPYDSKTDKGHIEPSLDSKTDKGHTEPSYDSKTDKADIEPHDSNKSNSIEPSQDSKKDEAHIGPSHNDPNEPPEGNALKSITDCAEPNLAPASFQPLEEEHTPYLDRSLLNNLSDEDDESDYDESMDGELKLSEICRRREIPTISWYIRKGKLPWAKIIESESLSCYEHYPTLYQMETLPEMERKDLFYRICRLEVNFEATLPKNLQFILTIIVFWYSKHKENVSLPHLLSALMSIVMFSIVDGKYGRNRGENHFTELKELSKTVKQTVHPLAKKLPYMSISDIIAGLSKEECRLASLNLHQFHQMGSCVKKRNYDRYILHSFSQYQASIYFLGVLNSMLFFPFASVNVKSFWSGTFNYNLVKCFSAEVNPYFVLKCLLGDNMRILHLFMKLYEEVRRHLDLPALEEKVLPVPKEEKGKAMNEIRLKIGLKKPFQLNLTTVSRNERTKREEKKAFKLISTVPEHDTLKNATEDDLIALAGNKFSLLLSEPVAQ